MATSPGALEHYAALVGLAERELELVQAAAWDELEALAGRRAELVRALPARPPAGARPALERAAVLQAQVSAALIAAQEPIARELARLASGRRGIAGYAGRGSGGRPSSGRVERVG